jgi:ParB family chromosome partitioning protein
MPSNDDIYAILERIILREQSMNASAQKKGLGKGLAALMADDVVQPHIQPQATAAPREEGPKTSLPISMLQAGKYQPRHRFDDDVLHELADSIEKNGILQPLVVRPIDATHYEVIAGERRLRAAKLAKLTEVPVIIRDVSDIQALEMALVENIQRADLNPIEEASGYQRLMEEFKYTQEKLASVVGKSRSHVANLLRLLDLPPTIKKLLVEGKISMGHARALIGVADAEQLAKRIVAEGLNVRQAETLASGGSLENVAAPVAAKAGKGSGVPRQSGKEAMKTDEVLEIENMLAENLGLKVSITTRGSQAGEVSISYDSLSQLDEILRRLGGTMY